MYAARGPQPAGCNVTSPPATLECDASWDRTSTQQARMQLGALLLTVVLAIASGMLTGYIVRCAPAQREYFSDAESWETCDDFDEADKEAAVALVAQKDESQV